MKLTILMYHKVDELHSGVRYPGNFVSPKLFERQMNALLLWGYRAITLEQWLDYREGKLETLPNKPLVITFDDGYTCFGDHAWPVMKPLGLRASVFLVAGQIGGWNSWDRDEVRLPLLGAERIRTLQDEGVQFGSHSFSHVPLAKIDPAKSFDELTRSRAVLSDLLGRDVTALAYPFSNQRKDVRELVRRAGYRCAVRGSGRMNWRSTSPFGLRRIKIDNSVSVARLKRLLFRERYLRLF